MPNTDNDSCIGVIPGTFIMCGEGGEFCSETCERNARFKAAQEKVLKEYAGTFEKLAKK